jgi:hypothetical protein
MSAVIDFDLPGAAILRMLIYPIQFESDPLNGIDRVVAQVVFADHSRLPLPDVIAAIDAGLASDAKLSELIPQSPHSDIGTLTAPAMAPYATKNCKIIKFTLDIRGQSTTIWLWIDWARHLRLYLIRRGGR